MAHDLLAGKTAVITGAGRNIGAGISRRFADHGATMVVNDVDRDRAAAVVESLATDHDQAHRTVVCDATDPEAVADAATSIEESHGSVDVLVNNAGYAANKGVFDLSVEEWYQVIDLTLTTGFLWTKHCGPLVIKDGGGVVINLASRLASAGATDKVGYCAAKGGVLNMTRQLALDLAEHDVRVNSISPGNVGTPVGQGTQRTGGIDTAPIPLGRVGDPEDIGDVALFLASDLSDYMTGANVAVDGGKGV